MIVVRESPFDGKVRSLNLDITEGQIEQVKSGEKICNVLSHLTADEREFFMTGLTSDQWEFIFSED